MDKRKKNIIGWAFYDVANSTYATIIATTIYNAYFVTEVAGRAVGTDTATLLLGIVTTVSSVIIAVSAPIIGTIADAFSAKKRALLIATIGCVLATASLALFAPGQYTGAMIALTIASVAYGTGEDIIAAFLPEIATRKNIGKVSAIGWAAGYSGGLIALGICFLYVSWASGRGQTPVEYTPDIALICALLYGCVSIPTFLWLDEDKHELSAAAMRRNYIKIAFARLRNTYRRSKHYRDLFSFLIALFVFSCGTTTVIQLAAVYAERVLSFSVSETISMIFAVNITSAVGALIFGWLQDRVGSVKTIAMALLLWIAAVLVAVVAAEKWHFWLSANFVGLAMGGTGSASRALVGRFSPEKRTGEFLGLWGLAIKFATAVGPLTFGIVTKITDGNLRMALLASLVFFIVGLLLMGRVNDERGVAAAQKIQ